MGPVDTSAIERARQILAHCDRVVIGAGEGLSAAAGLTYGGVRFRELFPAFIERYAMTDMYSAGFHPFPTGGERWAYWAHHATVNDLGQSALPLYGELVDWARQRDYFVLTTNADQQFEKAGVPPERLFATQGDYGHIQCATGRHGIVDDRAIMAAIERDTDHGRRTTVSDGSLVPTCEVCGGPMAMHLRVDDTFVEDEAWHEAQGRYLDFMAQIPERPTVLLELGVGWNTPVWIRMPFERVAMGLGCPLVRMNHDDARVDPALPEAVGVAGDMALTLPAVLGL